MKRLEFYLNDVRLATDNIDTNGVKDREIIQYFNDGVKVIQLIIFKHDPLCTYFLKETADLVAIKDIAIPLPTDCFSDNALATVLIKTGSCYSPLQRVFKEDTRPGYIVRGKNIYVNFTGAEAVKIIYVYRLPRFDKRWAKIDTKVGSVLNLLEATDTDLSLVDDTISIVDKDGIVIQENIKVSSYGLPTTITTSTTLLPAVASGQYIVSGSSSTTVCELPVECETYLSDYVKQRIFTRNNYSDIAKQGVFTDTQQASLVELFGHSSKDLSAPPITDTDYLWV